MRTGLRLPRRYLHLPSAAAQNQESPYATPARARSMAHHCRTHVGTSGLQFPLAMEYPNSGGYLGDRGIHDGHGGTHPSKTALGLIDRRLPREWAQPVGRCDPSKLRPARLALAAAARSGSHLRSVHDPAYHPARIPAVALGWGDGPWLRVRQGTRAAEGETAAVEFACKPYPARCFRSAAVDQSLWRSGSLVVA